MSVKQTTEVVVLQPAVSTLLVASDVPVYLNTVEMDLRVKVSQIEILILWHHSHCLDIPLAVWLQLRPKEEKMFHTWRLKFVQTAYDGHRVQNICKFTICSYLSVSHLRRFLQGLLCYIDMYLPSMTAIINGCKSLYILALLIVLGSLQLNYFIPSWPVIM